MKLFKNKNLAFIIIVVIIIAVIIKYKGITFGTMKPDIQYETHPIINFTQIENIVECHVGDNSSIESLINNLPGNEFYMNCSSKIDNKPYEININYRNFKEVDIKFDNGKFLTFPAEEIIKKNAAVIFAKITDVDSINIFMEDSKIYTFKKDEVRNEFYKEYNGQELEEIVRSEAYFVNFYNLRL